MRVLLLSPYPPFPPYGGGTMRIYQILRGLARRHAVTCLTFAPDAAAEAAMAPLREVARVIAVHGPPARSTAARAWTTLASPLPDMALRNASRPFAEALGGLLRAERFDVVQAESIETAGYLLGARRLGLAPRPLLVLDQFNAEYVLQRRAALTSLRSAASRSPGRAARGLAGGLYSLAQWAKLAAYERRALRACDAAVAVSEDDAATLGRLSPGARLAVVPNGVDTAEFSRAALGEPPPAGEPRVVFSGTLDFRPNVDALAWFADEVWPIVRAARPGARLVAVGKRPAPALRALAAAGALELTGEVPDARPHIASADAYVVPMRIGGGVRLKLLEALSLEAPVVSTSLGAEGVAGLRGGEHCLLADDPRAFADAVLRLLADPQLGRRLGSAGRALVRSGYDWGQIVPRLDQLYGSLRGG